MPGADRRGETDLGGGGLLGAGLGALLAVFRVNFESAAHVDTDPF